jgi:metal-responsive CopG/Arc/MetJ family transcriptional regulator
MGETVGARVSNTLRDRIDTYADQHGLSRSEAIEVLLRNGLGDDVDPEPPLYQQVQQLRGDLDDIDDRLSRLESGPLTRLLSWL